MNSNSPEIARFQLTKAEQRFPGGLFIVRRLGLGILIVNIAFLTLIEKRDVQDMLLSLTPAQGRIYNADPEYYSVQLGTPYRVSDRLTKLNFGLSVGDVIDHRQGYQVFLDVPRSITILRQELLKE